jgi:hypothetical protein
LLIAFKRNGARRRQDLIFFAMFTLAVTTALCAWGVAMIFDDHVAERMFVEIHDKVTIPMSILMALHLWNRRSRLLYGLRAHEARG